MSSPERVSSGPFARLSRWGLALSPLLGLSACERDAGPQSAPPPSTAVTEAAPSAAVAPPEPSAPPSAALSGEAAPGAEPSPEPARAALFDPGQATERRIQALRELPVLVPHEESLRAQLGELGPGQPFLVEDTALPEGRRAYLVSATKGDAGPRLLVLDEAGRFLWEKDYPFRGVTPHLRHLALSAGPSGEVAVHWHDATGWVATRMWNADGTILVDYSVLELDACDALSALLWPEVGTLVVASHLGTARAQVISPRGKKLWGPNGIDVSSHHGLPSPVTLVLDTPDTVVLLRPGLATGGGKRSPNRLLASRYDAAGQPLWEAPVDVALAPQGEARVSASRLALGVVGIELGGRYLTLTSSGVVGRGAVPLAAP